jgi:hypothetical protein
MITKKPTKGTDIRIIVQNQSDTDIRGSGYGRWGGGGDP